MPPHRPRVGVLKLLIVWGWPSHIENNQFCSETGSCVRWLLIPWPQPGPLAVHQIQRKAGYAPRCFESLLPSVLIAKVGSQWLFTSNGPILQLLQMACLIVIGMSLMASMDMSFIVLCMWLGGVTRFGMCVEHQRKIIISHAILNRIVPYFADKLLSTFLRCTEHLGL